MKGDLRSKQPHWLSQAQLKLRGLTTLHNEKVRSFSVKETIQLELEYPNTTTRGSRGKSRQIQLRTVAIMQKQSKRSFQ